MLNFLNMLEISKNHYSVHFTPIDARCVGVHVILGDKRREDRFEQLSP